MLDSLTIIIAIILIIGTTVFILFRLLLKRVSATKSKLKQELTEETIEGAIHNANCFGIESLGVGQVRGNGSWALTEKRILFLFWMGSRRIDIPLATIQNISMGKAFLGKAVGRELLIIHYTTNQGEQDKCAWLMSNPLQIKEHIERKIES